MDEGEYYAAEADAQQQSEEYAEYLYHCEGEAASEAAYYESMEHADDGIVKIYGDVNIMSRILKAHDNKETVHIQDGNNQNNNWIYIDGILKED